MPNKIDDPNALPSDENLDPQEEINDKLDFINNDPKLKDNPQALKVLDELFNISKAETEKDLTTFSRDENKRIEVIEHLGSKEKYPHCVEYGKDGLPVVRMLIPRSRDYLIMHPKGMFIVENINMSGWINNEAITSLVINTPESKKGEVLLSPLDQIGDDKEMLEKAKKMFRPGELEVKYTYRIREVDLDDDHTVELITAALKEEESILIDDEKYEKEAQAKANRRPDEIFK